MNTTNLLDVAPSWMEIIFDYFWFVAAALIAVIGLVIWFVIKKKRKK